MIRRFFCTAAVILCMFSVSAGGVMAGTTNKKVLRTQYFDIIYPEESAATAELVAGRIDTMYTHICDIMGEEPWLHLPVVITPVNDELNAYYTYLPYSRIVLYDTVPDQELAVYSETILTVLYHEMVHAVTINMKNKALRRISGIFGDLLTGEILNAPSSLAEGAAVSLESDDGEGRMNDEYSMHVVKQAKIEDRFPAWQNITGARDIYPSGELPYIFGGAFFSYIRKTYGSEKFSIFWRTLINGSKMSSEDRKAAGIKRKFYAGIFQQVYGINLDDAWRAFYDSIPVPDVRPDPADGSNCFAFLPETVTDARQKGRTVSVTSYISEQGKGAAWIDSSDYSVWHMDCSSGTAEKPEKICTLNGVSRCAFSSDGKYLALNYTENSAAVRNRVKIYCMENRKLYTLSEKGLRDACFVRDGDGMLYLAAVRTSSQNAQIVIYRVTEKKHSVSCSRTPAYTVPFETGTTPFSLTDAGNGSLAYTCKTGMTWSIRLYSIQDASDTIYSLPYNHMVIHSVAGISGRGFTGGQNGMLLAFSWTAPGTMPRLGYLAVKYTDGKSDRASWYLQKKDISGGIYTPAVYPLSQSLHMPDIVYSARFYDRKKLIVLTGDSTEFEKLSAETVQDGQKSSSAVQNSVPPAKKFSPFPYYTHGVLLPLGLNYLYDTDMQAVSLEYAGATWFTSDPWGGTVAAISAGINPYSLKYGTMLQLSGGLATSLFKYAASGSASFDTSGFFQTYNTLNLSSTVPVGTHSNCILNNFSQLYRGYGYDAEKKDDSFKDNDWFTAQNTASVQFSTVHKNGPGVFEYGGVFAGPFVTCRYAENITRNRNDDYNNAGFTAGFRLPYLIPVTNPEDCTLNLPETTTLQLFPKKNYFLSGTASLVLFSRELQNGTTDFLLPLYANRFTVSGVYEGKLKYKDAESWDIQRTGTIAGDTAAMDYYDSVSLSSVVQFRINTGIFSNLVTFSCGAGVEYDIRQEKDTSPVHIKLIGNLVF